MDKGSYGGIGIGSVLTLIFIVLKLTDYIDWSWISAAIEDAYKLGLKDGKNEI